MATKKNSGVVNIRGKDYQTVGLRIAKFREEYANWSIITKIEHQDDKKVVMSAQIVSDKNIIVATGHAEESRTSSPINRTSALENCETSAVGRALGILGLQGDEFTVASANEVSLAVEQQDKAKTGPLSVSSKKLEPMYTKDNKDPEIMFSCRSKGKKISDLSNAQASNMLDYLKANTDIEGRDVYIAALKKRIEVFTSDDIPF